MSISIESFAGPPGPTSGAPPGSPPGASNFHDALADELARTAVAEGHQEQSPLARLGAGQDAAGSDAPPATGPGQPEEQQLASNAARAQRQTGHAAASHRRFATAADAGGAALGVSTTGAQGARELTSAVPAVKAAGGAAADLAQRAGSEAAGKAAGDTAAANRGAAVVTQRRSVSDAQAASGALGAGARAAAAALGNASGAGPAASGGSPAADAPAAPGGSSAVAAPAASGNSPAVAALAAGPVPARVAASQVPGAESGASSEAAAAVNAEMAPAIPNAGAEQPAQQRALPPQLRAPGGGEAPAEAPAEGRALPPRLQNGEGLQRTEAEGAPPLGSLGITAPARQPSADAPRLVRPGTEAHGGRWEAASESLSRALAAPPSGHGHGHGRAATAETGRDAGGTEGAGRGAPAGESTREPGTGAAAEAATGGVEGADAGVASAAAVTSAQVETVAGLPLGASASVEGVDLQDMIETIHATVALAARQNASEARIALEPAELGQIRIHLTQSAEGLLVRVTAGSDAAAQALQAGRGELHHALSSLGTSLLRLDIGSSGEPAADQGWRAQQTAESERPSRGAREGAEEGGEPLTGLSTGAAPGPAGSLGELIDVLA